MVISEWKHVFYAWALVNIELSFLQNVGIFVQLILVVITDVEKQLGQGDVVWSVAAAELKVQYVCRLIADKTCIVFCFINGQIEGPLQWSAQP